MSGLKVLLDSLDECTLSLERSDIECVDVDKFVETLLKESRRIVLETAKVGRAEDTVLFLKKQIRELEIEYFRVLGEWHKEHGTDMNIKSLNDISKEAIALIVKELTPIFLRRADHLLHGIHEFDLSSLDEFIEISYKTNMLLRVNAQKELWENYLRYQLRLFILTKMAPNSKKMDKEKLLVFMRWIIESNTLFTYAVVSSGTSVWTRTSAS